MAKIRIYILDDDRFYGAMICRALEREDLDVTYFYKESDFFQAMRDPPQILILDHHLENSTGFQILEFLNNFPGPRPVVVYLSSQEHVHVALRALQLGAVNYFEKREGVFEELKDEIDRIVQGTKNFLQPLDRRKYILQGLKR